MRNIFAFHLFVFHSTNERCNFSFLGFCLVKAKFSSQLEQCKLCKRHKPPLLVYINQILLSVREKKTIITPFLQLYNKQQMKSGATFQI